jgi:hypothetical protein
LPELPGYSQLARTSLPDWQAGQSIRLTISCIAQLVTKARDMANEPQLVYRGHTLVDNTEFWEAVNAENPDFVRIKQMIAGAYGAETGNGDPTEH